MFDVSSYGRRRNEWGKCDECANDRNSIVRIPETPELMKLLSKKTQVFPTEIIKKTKKGTKIFVESPFFRTFAAFSGMRGLTRPLIFIFY